MRKNKFSSLKFISETYPNVDLESLDKIRHLYQNPSELDKICRDYDDMISLWISSLNTFESLVKEYVRNVPK